MLSHRTFVNALGFAFALGAVACGSSTPNPQALPAEPSEASKAQEEVVEIDPVHVAFAMRSHQQDLRACFHDTGVNRGFARLGWEIRASGEISELSVSDATFKSPTINACLKYQLREVNFGPAQGPRRAAWTFVYGLQSPEATLKLKRALEKQRKRKEKARRRRSRKQNELAQEAERQREAQGVAGLSIEAPADPPLDSDRIQSVVDAAYALFAPCYRAGIERDAELSGLLRLRFTIGSDGLVEAVEDAGSTLPDPILIDCIGEAFYTLEFPETGEPVRVVYPLELSAG